MAFPPWFRRRRLDDADLQDEIRSHLAIAEQDRMVEGADREAARRAAVKDFGNVTLTREAARQVWTTRWLDRLRDGLSDMRYAIRVLTRSRGFSAVVIAVLAVGIGLNAAVFTLFKSLALKPLAGVEDSGALGVILRTTGGGDQMPLSYPDYEFVRDQNQVFEGLTGSAFNIYSLGLGNRGERVTGELVTGNYFQVLGVTAALGRTILPSDDASSGGSPVVVLGHGLWRRVFGSDPAIVNRTIHLNGHPVTVVGVAEPDFHGTVVSFDIEIFGSVTMAPVLDRTISAQSRDPLNDHSVGMLMVLGRLRPGVAFDGALEQMRVLGERLAADAPIEDEDGERLTLLRIWQSPYGAQTYMLPAVTVLGAMGLLLLVIVCANIAGLVLVRGVSRRGEIAVRLALGASRGRILRLLLAENLVLAVPGAVAGLLAAWYALPLMWSGTIQGVPVPLFLDVSMDWLVVGFAIAVSSASALLFGLAPAFRSARVDLMSVMKDDLSPRSGTRGRLRAVLVASQVAVSLLLLVGASLVARSLDAAREADAGFTADNVTSISIDVAPNGYDEAGGRQFYEQLLDRVRADEGVEAASLAMTYPMSMVDTLPTPVAVEGYQPARGEDLTFLFNVVAPDYFRTLRIGLVEGREFERRDDMTGQQVVVVNETLARRFWGSAQRAMGQRVRAASGEWRTIIGVARDVKYARINEAPRPYVYLPFLQTYQPAMIVHTRGPAGVGVLIDQGRRRIAELDPNLPILGAMSLAAQAGSALGIFTMTARALLLFGLAAMGLAAMGIYGLVSYTVRQSTHEIGIRMALGAGRGDILRRFMGRGLRLTTMGAVVGVIAAVAVTRLLSGVLYGVSATDIVSFAGAIVVILCSALVATLVPAWRAAQTNPTTALRHQQ